MLLRLITGLALCTAAMALGFSIGIGAAHGGFVVCTEGDACIREWLAATSGWAAVCAALPTVLYLSKQIRDADRHQRTNFAIQLRRQRILATGVAQLAYMILDQIALMLSGNKNGESPNIRDWNKDLVGEMIRHLRGTVLQSFEDEIAFPENLGAYGVALIVEKGFSTECSASFTAPDVAKEYFERIVRQAEQFLAEIRDITEARLRTH
jgi:hypothetical protein